MTDQPEALRLADWLEEQYDPTHNQEQAAAELRRLHDLNADKTEIISALSADVERLREAARMALEALDIACLNYGEVGSIGTHWGDWDAAATKLRDALGEEK